MLATYDVIAQIQVLQNFQKNFQSILFGKTLLIFMTKAVKIFS